MTPTCRLLAVVLLGTCVSGCGSRTDVDALGQDRGAAATSTVPVASPEPSSSGTSRPAAPGRDALDLVGTWAVSGKGVEAGTVLQVADDIEVFRDCGVVDADWDADGPEGLFVASSGSGDGTCPDAARPEAVPWLQSAERFDVDGDARLLQDAEGHALARLEPQALRPTYGPNRGGGPAPAPSVSARRRARAGVPPPLPPTAQAPTPEQLQRRWVPRGAEQTKAELLFAADGRYSGSDGCNGAAGRYALGSRGRLLATSGPSTLIGCNGAPVLVSGASRAGLVGGDLVLYDRDGSELQRLAPG